MSRKNGAGRPDGPTLTLLGGAGTVTGSRFLVETSRSRVLVDCGLFQGLKALRLKNWEPFPVDPSAIDAVVITHSHVDHVGYLPRLVKLGFRGPVYCTASTAALAAIVLPDSGHLQEEEASFANRKGYSKHHPALPLYTEDEARESLHLLGEVAFGAPTRVADDITVTLRPAGHILGSATVFLEAGDGGPRVLFSGDLGRPNHPLLRPPVPPQEADVVVMESTYGGRTHEDSAELERLGETISRTASRGGTVVIPAFAVDRTEVVLFRLRELMDAGAVPVLPVYVDSPMALRALGVYRSAIASGAADVRPELAGRPDPFSAGQLHEVREVEESKALADAPHPAIIVSASGMASGGRVLHHLQRLLPDHRNTVVLVGFQAEGTRGRSLSDGQDEVRMFGTTVRVRADVETFWSFSVHADHPELLQWLGAAPRPPDRTILVHGEPGGSGELRGSIETDLGWNAQVADQFDRVSLR